MTISFFPKADFFESTLRTCIKSLYEQLNETALLSLGLIDEKRRPCDPTFPLKIVASDPPVILSIKSYLNSLYHFNQQINSLNMIQSKDSQRWLHGVRLLPSIYQLFQETVKQFHSLSLLVQKVNVLGKGLLDQKASLKKTQQKQLPELTEMQKILSSLTSAGPYAFLQEGIHKWIKLLKVIAKDGGVEQEWLQETQLNLAFFSQLHQSGLIDIDVGSFAQLVSSVTHLKTEEQQQYLLLSYQRFLKKLPTLLAEIEVTEARYGFKKSGISGPFFKAVQDFHRYMLTTFPNTGLEPALTDERTREQKYQLIKLKRNLLKREIQTQFLQELLAFIQKNKKLTMENISDEQALQLKSLYLPVQSQLAKLAPGLHQLLYSVIQRSPLIEKNKNWHVSVLIPSVQQLLRTVQDRANETRFTYQTLSGKALAKQGWEKLIQRHVEGLKKRYNKRALIRIQATADNRDYRDLVTQSIDKIQVLRRQFETTIKKQLSEVVINQLGWQQTEVKLPMTLSKEDAPQIKCIKHLLNSLYHAQCGLEFYRASQNASWFGEQLYYYIKALFIKFSHFSPFVQNLSLLQQNLKWMSHESVRGINVLSQAWQQTKLDETGQLAFKFVQATFDLSLASAVTHTLSLGEEEGLGTIVEDLSKTISALSNAESTPELLMNTGLHLQKSLATIQHCLARFSLATQTYAGVQSAEKLAFIFQKIIVNNQGKWDPELIKHFSDWLNADYLNFISAIDRMEEQLGLRRGCLSGRVNKQVENLSNMLGVKQPDNFTQLRNENTERAKTRYKALLQQYQLASQSASLFFKAIYALRATPFKALTAPQKDQLQTLFLPISEAIQAVAGNKHEMWMKVFKGEGVTEEQNKLTVGDLLTCQTEVIQHYKNASATTQLKLDITEFTSSTLSDEKPVTRSFTS